MGGDSRVRSEESVGTPGAFRFCCARNRPTFRRGMQSANRFASLQYRLSRFGDTFVQRNACSRLSRRQVARGLSIGGESTGDRSCEQFVRQGQKMPVCVLSAVHPTFDPVFLRGLWTRIGDA